MCVCLFVCLCLRVVFVCCVGARRLRRQCLPPALRPPSALLSPACCPISPSIIIIITATATHLEARRREAERVQRVEHLVVRGAVQGNARHAGGLLRRPRLGVDGAQRLEELRLGRLALPVAVVMSRRR